MTAGDLCVDTDLFCPTNQTQHHPNRERKQFVDLVNQIINELERSFHQGSELSPVKQTSLFEVYCGANSQLTHQCQQLGFRALWRQQSVDSSMPAAWISCCPFR